MERIIEIDFHRCYKVLCTRALALLMAAVFGLVAGLGISLAFFDQENQYAVYSEVSCIGVSDISAVPFYAEVVKTSNVANRASAILNDEYTVSQIINLIQANDSENLVSGVPIIEIGTVSQNPKEAVAIVDAVTEAFIVEIQMLSQNEAVRRLGESSNVEMLYNAKKTCALVTLGTALSFALVLGGILVLREILALQLTTIKDGLLNGELKLIGVIPRYKK